MDTKFTLLTLLFFFQCYQLQAQNCDCERHGKLVEFRNLHAPDYEEEIEEYLNCLRSHLGDQNIQANDPRFSQALEDCESGLPQSENYVWPIVIENRLAEKLTSRCFHLYATRFHKPATDNEPEYIFKGSYEYKPQGFHTIISDYGEEKLIVAQMAIGLYYNGNSPELIKEWRSENVFPDYFPLYKRLNIPQNLTSILDDFEKRPVTCNVETKTRMEMCKTGETEIVLTDFKDRNGNQARLFNRIMVTVRDGTILNGEKSMFGPDFRVFTLEEGEVTLKYRKSEDSKMDDKDLLRIYNSCDILPPEKQPLSKTRSDKMIKEEEITFYCLAIHVRETESGAIKGDDGSTSYPYNYTVSMQFRGKIINSKSLYQTVAKLPDALRKMVMREGSMSLKDECTLIAELEPDEKSMKVEQWKCSDPVNNTPPPPLLGTHPAEFDVPTRIWQIGQKIYISHGFLDGILSYFPSWEDPRSSNSKEPAGARADGPSGEMGEYIEVPYEKFINGETITLKPKDVSDHNDDEWQWNTHWTVTINPD